MASLHGFDPAVQYSAAGKVDCLNAWGHNGLMPYYHHRRLTYQDETCRIWHGRSPVWQGLRGF